MHNAEWVGWVAENAALGSDPKAVINLMVNAGFTQIDAEQLFSQTVASPLFAAYKKLYKNNGKLAAVMTNLRKLQQQSARFLTVDRVDRLDADAFFSDYWLQNKPVIIRQLAQDWPAMSKWSMEYLAKAFGDELVEIQEGRKKDKEYEINSVNHRTKVRFADFIQRIAEGPSNDFYMTANNNALQNRLAGLLTDVGTLPSYVNAPSVKDGEWHLWIGPQGTITPLHHDENAILHTQIQGRKHWKFISPLDTPNLYNHIAVFSEVDLYDIDYTRFPKMRNVPVIDVVVEPGETIFIPLGWWHGVESLDPAISVSFTSFKYPNYWMFNNP